MRTFRSSALAIAVSCLSLAGCATTTTDPGTGAVTTVQPTMAQIIEAVQAACTTACKFVPTAATIAAIITASNPGVTTAAAVSKAICTALETTPPLTLGKKAARKYGGATVNGVVIEGWLVSNKFRGAARVPMVNGVPIAGHYVN